MNELISLIIKVVLINVMMIIFHEIGHYLMIKNLGIKRFRPFFLGIEFDSNDEDAKKVLLSGVLTGFIPLIFMGVYGGFHEFIVLLVLLTYLIPCWSDIKYIREKGGMNFDVM